MLIKKKRNQFKTFNCGCCILIGAAMLVYKTISGTKNLKKAVHLSIQLLAFLLSVIGVYVAYKFHYLKGIDDFYNLYSWLGLGCLILFGVQVCTITNLGS